MERLGKIAGRELFLLSVDQPTRLPEVLHELPSPYFIGLIAWNASQQLTPLLHAAKRILGAGCVYACCWGERCEDLHDAFDIA